MSYGSMSVSERRLLPPAVAVSTVAFALRPPEGAEIDSASQAEASAATTLWLPLVRRTRPPFDGHWALPGDPIPWDETLVDTALRTLRSAARRDPGYLEQLYSFGAVERSAEAQRLVTIAYWALYGEEDLASPELSDADTETYAVAGAGLHADARVQVDAHAGNNVAWFSADALPHLAFDHGDIVAYALDRLRGKTAYSTVAFHFLDETFTLAQLREVREAILGENIDPANFRRQALAQGYLIDTGRRTSGDRHRPSRLYRFAGNQSHTTGGIA